MAKGSLNVTVSRADFERRMQVIEIRMNALIDVINRYGSAKSNLDQFITSEDDNFDAMVQRIDTNVLAAKKAHAALNQIKVQIQTTLTQMDEMSGKVKETITSATDAAKSTVEAAIKINSIL